MLMPNYVTAQLSENDNGSEQQPQQQQTK